MLLGRFSSLVPLIPRKDNSRANVQYMAGSKAPTKLENVIRRSTHPRKMMLTNLLQTTIPQKKHNK